MHASPFGSHALETVDHMESEFPQESRALVPASQEDISDTSNNLLPPWSRDQQLWVCDRRDHTLTRTTLLCIPLALYLNLNLMS